MARAELIRWTTEMFGKGLDGVQAGLYGGLRVIATLEFLQHHYAQERVGIQRDGLTVAFVVCLVSEFPFLDISGDKNAVY